VVGVFVSQRKKSLCHDKMMGHRLTNNIRKAYLVSLFNSTQPDLYQLNNVSNISSFKKI